MLAASHIGWTVLPSWRRVSSHHPAFLELKRQCAQSITSALWTTWRCTVQPWRRLPWSEQREHDQGVEQITRYAPSPLAQTILIHFNPFYIFISLFPSQFIFDSGWEQPYLTIPLEVFVDIPAWLGDNQTSGDPCPQDCHLLLEILCVPKN